MINSVDRGTLVSSSGNSTFGAGVGGGLGAGAGTGGDGEDVIGVDCVQAPEGASIITKPITNTQVTSLLISDVIVALAWSIVNILH